ncbi:MAG: bifunctional folylpolyglutamate synthase/dihydrofolate synthase, partial [Methyloligellaceae bacterium]
MAKSAELLAQLKTRYTEKLDMSVDRMQLLMDKLDNPQTKLPRVIHVSGSNGKESVLAFIQSILYASGIRVHKYTSNHLASFNERIGLSEMTGTKPISEKKLVEVLTRVIKANGDAPLTFFEATTAAALLAFSETPADILLVGAGQGGGV